MKLYENIKKRRLELNISQQELAERVGYAGKSMISQVEKGTVDLSETMIMKFAAALDVTPAYLMGWEDERVDVEKEFQAFIETSDSTQSHIKTYLDMFSKLSPESRKEVLNYIDYQIEKEKKNV